MASQLVSVIVPVYNSEKYLSNCVDSILRQSYTNLEVLLIDDGSTDGSPEICDDYAHQDSRVRVVHQSNGGISAAQNAGLDMARGAYITFSDNDDILAINNIEVLVEALERSGADLAKGRWQQFGLSTLSNIIEKSQVTSVPEHLTTFSNPLNCYQNIFSKALRLLGGRRKEAMYFNEANWCKLYKRELWDGIRFPLGRYAQDVAITSDLYSRVDVVADVDAVLYYWLQSDASVTHTDQKFSYYDDNILTGLENFEKCLAAGITPARSYYQIHGALKFARETSDFMEPKAQEIFRFRVTTYSELLAQLSFAQRLRCMAFSMLRNMENVVYNRTVLTMK